MYVDGLGMHVLGVFRDHDGFDGVILGHPRAPYHLEFTSQHRHPAGMAPSPEHLLVFYVPGVHEWRTVCRRMLAAGFRRVESNNPYWDVMGATFEDIDGYRIVVQRDHWDR